MQKRLGVEGGIAAQIIKINGGTINYEPKTIIS